MTGYAVSEINPYSRHLVVYPKFFGGGKVPSHWCSLTKQYELDMSLMIEATVETQPMCILFVD